MQLQHKIAVITGVSKGIGYAVTQQLLSEGAIVFGLGQNQGETTHPNFTFIPCDVRQPTNVETAFKSILQQTNNTIHILINNAGLGYFGFLEDTTYEQWNDMQQTNVNGIFYCCKQALPIMKKMQVLFQ